MTDNSEAQLAQSAGLEPGLDTVDCRARLVARTWHACPDTHAALAYRGINLAVPLEQVLVHDLIPLFAEAEKQDRP